MISSVRMLAWGMVVAAATAALPSAQQDDRSQKPVFRTARNAISVDVIVRDKSGNVVRGLTPADFEVREDGRPQEVIAFSFEEIAESAAPIQPGELLAGVEEKVKEEARHAGPPAGPMSAEALAGRRLITLVFDISSMQPEDVQRAVDSARKYVGEKMNAADLVAVATVGTLLDVLVDFTADRTKVDRALARLGYSEGTTTDPNAAATAASDEAAAAAEEEAVAEAAELDMFNNDVRLRALKTLAEALAPIEQKKAIVYFSAGMERSGQDNQIELRSAINASVRANVSIYPVDVRGLQAVVPGGDARQASGRGTSLFSGRGMQQQFARLSASEDTLTSLAADTGGRAFTDSNEFGEAFARVQRDMSAYYLLAYSTTNPLKDGRFRRIQVRVKREGLRVEARAGYYADRDFAHTNRSDREVQLQEQMFAAVSATDLPLLVTGGWFRMAPDRYYVPIALVVPGYAVPVPEGRENVSLDVLGLVRDEQGRPLGRFRETLNLPVRETLNLSVRETPNPSVGRGFSPGDRAGEATLAGKQVLYQSAVTLPPGRFSVKVVVRENARGAMGSFEAPLMVPELKQAPVKVSSVVLSTQLEPVTKKSESPLVRDGVQLVPNLTHVVSRDQKLYFYYEVYEPGDVPQVRTSLAFYRGKVKVFETPVIERTRMDEPGRRAALFRLEVPADRFTPGLYTCQINIIDVASGKFTFPRLLFYVR